MKQFVTLLTLLLVTYGVARSETFKVGGIWYETVDNNQNVCVAPVQQNEANYSGSISVPGSVTYAGRDYAVTSIGKGAFSGATGMTAIAMDGSIGSIEDAAFKGCTGITSVEIPQRTTFVGASAFEGCTKLGTVTLSSRLNTIKNRAFANCTSLSRIDVEDRVTSIGDEAFLNCSRLSTIVLPSGLKSIGNSAFAGCSVLDNITLGNNLTFLGEGAFKDCKALKSIAVPEKITEIKAMTFSGCSVLSGVTFPSRLSVIGASAFKGTALTSVTIPDTVGEIGDEAFNGSKGLMSVTFSDSETPLKYGNEVFTGCPVESLILGRTLNYMQGVTGAFAEQVKLKTVKVTSTVTTLPESVFRGCTALVNVTVESGLREVGQKAFQSCETLVRLQLPETVSIIRPYAFANCYLLSDFTIPSKVETIELQSFYRCRRLKAPNLVNIKEIKNQAFYGCDDIDGLTLSQKLVTIANDAFADCLSLSAISIPGTVINMGDGVFYGCKKLASVVFEAGSKPLSVGSELFVDCPVRELELGRDIIYRGDADKNLFDGNTTLYDVNILGSVTSIADNMFSGCEALTAVVLPSSVTKVGNRAFGNCPELASVTSRSETVPTAVTGSFSSEVYNNAVLTVPADSENAYRSAPGWKNFKQFSQLPSVPKYTVSVEYSGPGQVTVNGSASGEITVRQGEPLTIVATPDNGKTVTSASYTMGGMTHAFSTSATIESVTGNVSVNVQFGDEPEILPSSISITPDNVSVGLGESVQLFLTCEPEGASDLATWSVQSGNGIVTVDASGLVTGVSAGMAVVKAVTPNGLSATANVVVIDGSASIDIPTLEVGQKWQARLIVDGNPVAAGVTWSSSNPSEVSVSNTGMVTVKVQKYDWVTAVITAKYQNTEYVYEYRVLPINLYSFVGDDGLSYFYDPRLDGVVVENYQPYEPSSANMTIKAAAVDGFGYDYDVKGIETLRLADYVKSLTLPASVVYIGESVYLSGLDMLIILAEQVPQTEDLDLADGVMVFVPASALAAYKADPNWGRYNIFAVGSNPVHTYTVYFLPQSDAPAIGTPYCYIWSKTTGKLYAGTWPGSLMTSVNIDGRKGWRYSVEVSDPIDSPMVIFSDSMYQTGDMVLEHNGLYDWAGLTGYVSGITDVKADASGLTVDGLNVEAEGLVRVYTFSGILVCEGENRVSLPSAGAYVVVTSAGAVRIQVK